MYHVSETRVGGHSVSVCPHLENTWRFRASPSTYTLARNVLFNPSMLSVFDLTSGHQMSSWLFLVFVAVLIKDRHFSNMNPLQADSLICRLNLTDLQWTAGGRWPSGHWRTVCWWQSSSRPHVGGREERREGGGSALAGREHPLLVDSSSHMAAARRQDSWWEQDKQRGKIKRFDLYFWNFHPTVSTACLALSPQNASSGLYDGMAWVLIIMDICTLGKIPLNVNNITYLNLP